MFGLGLASRSLASLLVALALDAVGAEFEGAAAQIFEGLTMLLAAGVLTWMIFWMQREGGRSHQRLTADVRAATGGDAGRSNVSLFLLAFLAVFREGIELALFLVATTFATSAAADGHRRAAGLLLPPGWAICCSPALCGST